MIDLHCHFLPGIDDGAANLDEALTLARASVDNGVRCAIMTPHLHPGRWENFADEIARHTQRFRSALAEADIPLKVGFAAEVRLSPEIPSMIEQGRVPFLGEMGGHRVMLLEFPHGHIPLGADKLVARLLKMNVRPVIAHPERNKDVMRDPGKLAPFVDMGCILQLTAASVCGRFGERAHRTALTLLETDTEKLLASDAHNVSARPPLMREGMAAAARVVGEEAAGVMAHSLPLRIVASQFRQHREDGGQAAAPAGAKATPSPEVIRAPLPGPGGRLVKRDRLQREPVQETPKRVAHIARATIDTKTLAPSASGKPAGPAPANEANPAAAPSPESVESLLVNLIDERLQRMMGRPAGHPQAPSGEELARQYHRELVRLLDGQVTRWVQRELRRSTSRAKPLTPGNGQTEAEPSVNRDRSPLNK